MKNSDEGILHLSAPMVVREPTPCALTPGCTGELRPWPVARGAVKCSACGYAAVPAIDSPLTWWAGAADKAK